jgi:hypothetical protein
MGKWTTNHPATLPRLEIERQKKGFVVHYADRTSEILRTRADLYRVLDAFYEENQEQD